jgi:hypothetical protein
MFDLDHYYSDCFRTTYVKIYVFKFFSLNKVVSPLPGKASFSAFYGICFIKIRLVLYNLPVPFAGCPEKIGWKEEGGDGWKEMLRQMVSSGPCDSFKTMYVSAFIYFQSRILTCQSRHNF